MTFRYFIIFSAILLLAAWAAIADTVPYEVADWLESGFGNHRAVVAVDQPAELVAVELPWRRRDNRPAEKGILVFDRDGRRMSRVAAEEITPEYGKIVFQPESGAGNYYVYYLPYILKGMVEEEKYFSPAEAGYFHFDGDFSALPAARVTAFQSRGEFNSFYPMEVCATPTETEMLRRNYAEFPFLIFPEDRVHSIRMPDRLPLRWIENGPSQQFDGNARPGEYYVFQLGVWAHRQELTQLDAACSGLTGPGGKTIPVSCFNTDIVDFRGNREHQQLTVAADRIQPLWFGVDIPADAAAGSYRGTIAVTDADGTRQEVAIALEVAGEVLADGGVSDITTLSRLQWLNSRRGLEPEVMPQFAPLTVANGKIAFKNRSMTIGDAGLPVSITANGVELLASPMELCADQDGGSEILRGSEPAAVVTAEADLVEMHATSASGGVTAEVAAQAEADGIVSFHVRLVSAGDRKLDNLRLRLPLNPEAAQYWMGMEQRGGFRGDAFEWKWNDRYINNAIWFGAPEAGLQLRLQSPGDPWALWSLPIEAGTHWDNRGRGGVRGFEADGSFVVEAYCGALELTAQEPLELRFRLSVTPFRELSNRHWNYRVSDRMDSAETRIFHMHHGSYYMPYINYPFSNIPAMKDFIAGLHARGKEVQLYYTVRELSNHCAELWAFRSFGDEIFTTGGGLTYTEMGAFVFGADGGYPWLQEHLKDGYVPAWRTTWLPEAGLPGDFCAAITTNSDSRLINYYVEALYWLFRETGATGLYLDGIGYNREVTKRVAKALAQATPDYRINSHCSDLYEASRTSAMNQIMEHLPYMTDLWIGEYYNYNRSPDYYLIEISGIPFGLTNEMLNYQNGGNPWRGMIFGMSGRFLPDVEAMWRFWDRFGMEESEMLGYWDRSCPVTVDRADVKATVYRKNDQALIALAHWPEDSSNQRRAEVPLLPPERKSEADCAVLSRFTDYGSTSLTAIENQTRVLAAVRDGNLVFTVQCHQPGEVSAVKRQRDGELWEDDSIELFLQPDPGQKEYFQFILNAAGSVFDGKNRDSSWNCNWQGSAKRTEYGWEGTFSIPCRELGIAQPQEGMEFGVNFCRHIGDQASCWSPPDGSFHNSGAFGRMRIAAPGNATAESLPQPEDYRQNVEVRLTIDPEIFPGFHPEHYQLVAEAIDSFQPAATFQPNAAIPVPAGKGWLLWLKPKP